MTIELVASIRSCCPENSSPATYLTMLSPHARLAHRHCRKASLAARPERRAAGCRSQPLTTTEAMDTMPLLPLTENKEESYECLNNIEM